MMKRRTVFSGMGIKARLSMMILCCLIAAAAEAQQKCDPPKNINFRIASTKTHIEKANDVIIVSANDAVSFDQSLQSGGTVTWDYGDYSSDSNSSATGKYTTFQHSYGVPGAYSVKLIASRSCGPGETSP